MNVGEREDWASFAVEMVLLSMTLVLALVLSAGGVFAVLSGEQQGQVVQDSLAIKYGAQLADEAQVSFSCDAGFFAGLLRGLGLQRSCEEQAVDARQVVLDSRQALIDEQSYDFIDRPTLVRVVKSHDETSIEEVSQSHWDESCGDPVLDNVTLEVTGFTGCTVDDPPIEVEHTNTVIDDEYDEIVTTTQRYEVPNDRVCVDQPDQDRILCISVPNCLGVLNDYTRVHAESMVNAGCENTAITYANPDVQEQVTGLDPLSYTSPTLTSIQQQETGDS